MDLVLASLTCQVNCIIKTFSFLKISMYFPTVSLKPGSMTHDHGYELWIQYSGWEALSLNRKIKFAFEIICIYK